ncbi:MAG: transcriptional regulator [Rhizobiales bacterium 24-66-13]|nr:MAG: transcriptional regulator [Rhizobiales bacterium 12-66-7]OYY88060.1 MAG: transcriptional regulator [Rhizobiales bacterium 35-66-30]OYZ81673.1 MAG: transcriptional regulator [Rhizobiales bacterium 24-66-13]OZB09641.1 MAG: transcriptional regulator [Rhizobiales bacterium 39-66-18]HQS09572.1 LysR family transcriptional regulator [Xanthobacteraceae bacterium]
MDRFQAMQAFVTVVEAGSFSAAARQIGVGQPAISKTIAQLEERLQVRLLVRSTHSLAPTDAGLRFYERARAAIREAEEAELEARGAGAGLSGRLRISAATTFARLLIVPRLPEFLARHPDIEIDVLLDDRVIDLVSEGVDLALRMGELIDSTAIARRIARGQRSVLATPAYLARAGTPLAPADLATHEAIVYSQLGASWTFRRNGAQASVAVKGRVRLSAAEGIRAAVLADMGLTVNSDWMFAPELESGAVRRVLEDWELPPVDLWAVFPTGRLASAKARAFADYVESIFAQ